MQGRADGGRPRLLQRRVLSPSGALQALSGAYGGPSTSAPQAVTHADSSSSGLHRMTPASGRRGSRSASPPTRARSPAVIREPLSSPPVAVRCQRCCGRAPAQTGSGRLPVLRPVLPGPPGAHSPAGADRLRSRVAPDRRHRWRRVVCPSSAGEARETRVGGGGSSDPRASVPGSRYGARPGSPGHPPNGSRIRCGSIRRLRRHDVSRCPECRHGAGRQRPP